MNLAILSQFNLGQSQSYDLNLTDFFLKKVKSNYFRNKSLAIVVKFSSDI